MESKRIHLLTVETQQTFDAKNFALQPDINSVGVAGEYSTATSNLMTKLVETHFLRLLMKIVDGAAKSDEYGPPSLKSLVTWTPRINSKYADVHFTIEATKADISNSVPLVEHVIKHFPHYLNLLSSYSFETPVDIESPTTDIPLVQQVVQEYIDDMFNKSFRDKSFTGFPDKNKLPQNFVIKRIEEVKGLEVTGGMTTFEGIVTSINHEHRYLRLKISQDEEIEVRFDPDNFSSVGHEFYYHPRSPQFHKKITMKTTKIDGQNHLITSKNAYETETETETQFGSFS